ncbi:MAG: hypothetical protein Fur0015_07170 [Ignavibacteriales bacterium]
MIATKISFQQKNNLTVLQFATEVQNTFNYISAERATKENFIEMKEINERGSVNNIIVVNRSNEFVFFSDGDILKGAKQNRVVNASILIGPNSENNIPVSCIEAGRWRFNHNRNFNNGAGPMEIDEKTRFIIDAYVAPTKLRKEKSRAVLEKLEVGQKHYSDQKKVWDFVSDYTSDRNIESSTNDLGEVFNRRGDRLDEFIKNFTAEKDSNGIAIFIKNKLSSIDIYNRTDIYNEYFPKILKSAADEVLDLEDIEEKLNEGKAEKMISDIFDSLENLEKKVFPGVVLGQEKRFTDKSLNGFTLEYDGHKIHTSIITA